MRIDHENEKEEPDRGERGAVRPAAIRVPQR